MQIKNRLLGSFSGVFAGSLSRAEKVAKAELGCVAVAPVVFLPATRAMASRFVKLLRRRKRDGDTYRGKIGAYDVSVVNTGVGTPSAEGKVLACLGLGADVLLRFDLCGGLEAGMKVGDVVVAERAVPFDNTTRLIAGGEEVSASPVLLRVAKYVLADARRGPDRRDAPGVGKEGRGRRHGDERDLSPRRARGGARAGRDGRQRRARERPRPFRRRAFPL